MSALKPGCKCDILADKALMHCRRFLFASHLEPADPRMEDHNLGKFDGEAAALQASLHSKSPVVRDFMATLSCRCIFCSIGSSATHELLMACLTEVWMALLSDVLFKVGT